MNTHFPDTTLGPEPKVEELTGNDFIPGPKKVRTANPDWVNNAHHELENLDFRIDNLKLFLSAEVTVPIGPNLILHGRQLRAMQEYRNILNQRLKTWETEGHAIPGRNTPTEGAL